MAFSAGWVIGVLLAVLASVVSNLGLNLQKRAHMNVEKLAKEKEHHHHHGSTRSSRMRSGSVAATGNTPTTSTPEKAGAPVNPLSPTGILKKAKNGTSEGGYHLMDESAESEEVLVRRDEKKRKQQDLERERRNKTMPLSMHDGGSNGGAGASESDGPDFGDKSYTSAYELDKGGVDLDPFTKTLSNNASSSSSSSGRRGSATSSSGHTVAFQDNPAVMMNGNGSGNGNGSARAGLGRARSMSAATTDQSRRQRSSRHGRRRSSVNTTEAGAAAAAATTSGGAPSNKRASGAGHYTRQPMWVAGIICVILGSLFDFAALAFVDQAVVAPLGSLTLVSNVFFAPLLLKEKVQRKQLYCTALIIGGSILAVAFAPHTDHSPDVKEMFHNFMMPRFIVYFLLCTAVLIALRYASYRLNRIRRQDLHAYQHVSRYHTFCYAALAGIMGAQSVLFAKCTAMLLASTFSGKGILFVFWQSYFILLGLGITIFMQIRWLNSGLQRFSALLIVPIFQSFWILVSVIAGMIFFGEYQGVFSHPANAVMFPFGLLLTITGVYILTRISAPGASTEEGAKNAAAAGAPAVGGAAAKEGQINAAAGGTGTIRSKRSRRTGSLTGPLGSASTGAAADSHAIVMRTGTSATPPVLNGAEAALGPATGTDSSPLLMAAGTDYGSPTSPRQPGAAPQQPDGGAAAAGAAGPRGTLLRKPSLERVVDAGSYSDTGSPSLGRDGGEEEDDRFDEEEGEDEEEEDDEGSCSSDEYEGSDDADTSSYHTLMMHSLAPINFLMTSLIPSRLMEEPTSPSHHRHAYFEENASGFGFGPTTSDATEGRGGANGNGGGGGSGGGGNALPYANIFRVREEERRADGADSESFDEENPSPPGGGANLFSTPTTSPRVVRPSSSAYVDRPASPSTNGRAVTFASLNGGDAEEPAAVVPSSVGMFDPSHSGSPAGAEALRASPASFGSSSSSSSLSNGASAAAASGDNKKKNNKAKGKKKQKSPLENGDDSITDSLL